MSAVVGVLLGFPVQYITSRPNTADNCEKHTTSPVDNAILIMNSGLSYVPLQLTRLVDPATDTTITSFTVPVSLVEATQSHVAEWVRVMAARGERGGLVLTHEVVSLPSVML